jgi:hypothetical protein
MFAAAGVVAIALMGCGDDADNEILPEGNGQPRPDAGPPFDAGALDAGMTFEDLGFDAGALTSELTADEAQQFCKKLDEVGGLIGDVDKACDVEAFLLTYDMGDCESIAKKCKSNKQTVLGLELPLQCSDTPAELTGCDAPLDEVLYCATALGAFWSLRDCSLESLYAEGPRCAKDLTHTCPILFGQPEE